MAATVPGMMALLGVVARVRFNPEGPLASLEYIAREQPGEFALGQEFQRRWTMDRDAAAVFDWAAAERLAAEARGHAIVVSRSGASAPAAPPRSERHHPRPDEVFEDLERRHLA